ITGNDISGVGPAGGFVGRAIGIRVQPPFGGTEIADNQVRRHESGSGPANLADGSDWIPLLVLGTLPVELQPNLADVFSHFFAEAGTGPGSTGASGATPQPPVGTPGASAGSTGTASPSTGTSGPVGVTSGSTQPPIVAPGPVAGVSIAT